MSSSVSARTPALNSSTAAAKIQCLMSMTFSCPVFCSRHARMAGLPRKGSWVAKQVTCQSNWFRHEPMGETDMPEPIAIPARRGKAVFVRRGQTIKVINTHGEQVVDTWAFNRLDLGEFMSMEHSRATHRHLIPRVGDALLTNRRRPILTILEDTSGGVHDTLMAACDRYRYEELGCTEYHDNCTDNLVAALAELGL